MLAAAVGLAGRTVRGLAFTLHGGRAAWDRAGKAAAGGPRWLVSDHLGTPRMTADKAGSLAGIKRHDYLAFGEALMAGTGGRTAAQGYAADNIRQQFTGYERDKETALDFAQARYYAHGQGRFTGVDPLQASASVSDPQSFNRYTYAANNPLRYTDPSGMAIVQKSSLDGLFEQDPKAQEANRQRQERQGQSQAPPTLSPPEITPVFVGPSGPVASTPGIPFVDTGEDPPPPELNNQCYAGAKGAAQLWKCRGSQPANRRVLRGLLRRHE